MNNFKNILIAILVGALILLCIRNCKDKQSFAEERKGYVLNDSLNQELIKKTRDENGREIAKYKVKELNYEQLLTSSDGALAKTKADLEKMSVKLKRVTSITNVGLATVDSVLVPIHDTILVAGTDNFKNQKNFVYGDKWLNLTGKANFSRVDGNILFDSLNINYDVKNELTFSYAYDRNWFLGKKYLSLTVTSENPNTTTGRVQTFVVKPEKRFYEKWWFQTALGFAAGVVITEQIIK